MSQQMDNSHRKFLQGMMTNGIVDEQTAKKLYQQCCDTYKTTCLPDKLNDFIDTINSKLQPMFMQIRTGKSEENGQQHYALVNMDETNISCMSSDYPDYELEIFKKTMELIVCSETGQVSSTEILNTTDTMKVKKLKKSETEQLLKRLVREKWLTEKHGEYCLSTRCVIEMEPYIRTMYQEQVNVCHICHNIAIQCQTCENPTCSIKIHKPCVARYFKNKRQPCCPACDDSWPHEIPATHRPRSSQSK